MYAAKAQGQGPPRRVRPVHAARAPSRLDMEAELRHAIDADEFVLHYQPIVDLASSRIVGVRGARPLAAPDARPHRAARLHPAGRGDRAHRAARPDGDHGGVRAAPRAGVGPTRELTMSVNVSPRQADRTRLRGRDRGDPRRPGSSPSARPRDHRIADAPRVGRQRRVPAAAARSRRALVVDDFGTGFSALEYFKRFAVHGLRSTARSSTVSAGRERTRPS